MRQKSTCRLLYIGDTVYVGRCVPVQLHLHLRHIPGPDFDFGGLVIELQLYGLGEQGVCNRCQIVMLPDSHTHTPYQLNGRFHNAPQFLFQSEKPRIQINRLAARTLFFRPRLPLLFNVFFEIVLHLLSKRIIIQPHHFFK